MPTIIALRGIGNTGKSSTIRILYDLLLENGFQQVNYIDYGRDFSAIFSNNGQLIGITSSGDTYDLVHGRLQDLVNENCSICVCACRTYDRVPPGTNAAILEFENYENQFVEKTIDYNDATQAATNTENAQQLLNCINNRL